MLATLRQLDADAHFESFLLRLGDHCGLVREELGAADLCLASGKFDDG